MKFFCVSFFIGLTVGALGQVFLGLIAGPAASYLLALVGLIVALLVLFQPQRRSNMEFTGTKDYWHEKDSSERLDQ